MLDIKFVRENPDIVKENIKKKFQDSKLPLVDEVIDLDAKSRAAKQEADELRAQRNKLSKQIGALMGQGKKEEAEEVKAQVTRFGDRLAELEVQVVPGGNGDSQCGGHPGDRAPHQVVRHDQCSGSERGERLVAAHEHDEYRADLAGRRAERGGDPVSVDSQFWFFRLCSAALSG